MNMKTTTDRSVALTSVGDREADAEFNFAHAVNRLSRSVGVLPLFLAGAIVITIATFAFLPKSYTAQMTTAEKAQDAASLGNMAMGLASSVLPFLSRNDTSFDKFQYLLTSRDVAAELFRDPKILAGLYKEKYDEVQRKFVQPDGFIAALKRLWHEVRGLPAYRPPSPDDLAKYVSNNLKTSLDKEHNVVTLSYDNEDPSFALYFLTTLSRAADTKLREETRLTSEHQIKYLSDTLESVTNMDTRNAMITTLSQLQNNLMLAATERDFAFDLISSPSVSTDPTKPSLPIYFIAVFIVMSAAWALLAYRFEMTFGGLRSKLRGWSSIFRASKRRTEQKANP